MLNLKFAELITIGDEILYGQILDTNTKWMSEELDKIGIKIIRKTSVGDQEDQIFESFTEAKKRANIVLITGGLGPTKDDITKKVLCDFFKDTLVINTHAEAFIKEFFEKRNRPFTELNRQQAALPSKCTYLHNATGTAPGMWFESENTVFVSMPGVPYEMQYLMSKEVLPRLQKLYHLLEIVHRVIRTMGMGESFLAEKIETWEDALPENIKLAYLPSPGEVKLRLTGTGQNRSEIENQINNEVLKLIEIIPDFISSTNNEEAEFVLSEILKNRKETISTAESCTGGYLAHLLSSVSGASAYYKGSIIAYANEVKNEKLNVKQETLSNFGAVSEETVKEMAENVIKELKTTYGIAISGIAGPNGGSEEKPVGLVYIALSNGHKTIVKKLLLGNNRLINIQFSAKTALNEMRKFIQKL